ncbi:MAG: isochorismatase family protein [Deinococcus sp.]|uniref:isochorismatase family protein n=1 Tax=Deinococcus sp. TaxID=47478 RepID=UPI0026DAEBB0|nr:isochorismatase family protein [Deinococcus sp.]MDO4244826.1 isochorismatase family protein [Deinococcus sp.]
MSQALLVIDMQNGVVDGAYRLHEVTGNILAAVAQARAEGQSVVWVQHSGK